MSTARRSGSKRSPRTGSAGCLLFLAAIILVILLFLFNWTKIKETLDHTNFSSIVQGHGGSEPANPAPLAPVAPATRVEVDNQGKPAQGTQVPPGNSRDSPSIEIPDPSRDGGVQGGNPAAGPISALQGASEGSSAGTATAPSAQKPALPPAALSRIRPALLYFVRIDDDGVIIRQEVKRSIPASDSPLTDALSALLRGPSEDELRGKMVSLIPQGTKLLGVQVKGSTAVLNFNEAFMYNRYGIEGYAGQLKQVVFTATAFSNVQDVQILIDGERHDYLGGEGVYIGRPLSRNSF